MESLQLALMIFAMVATLVVLVVGVVSFATHGESYIQHANKLMRTRVFVQGLVLAVCALIALVVWFVTGSPG